MNSFTDLEKKLFSRRLVNEETGCWLWTGAWDSSGYGRIGFTSDQGFVVSHCVHRLAAKLWLGLKDESLVVRHTCENKHCFNPDHLLLGTQLDNMLDEVRKGKVGKLTEEDVRRIRVLRAEGKAQYELALQFNVSESAISKLLSGETYSHVS